MKIEKIPIPILVAVSLLALPRQAHAYVDPGAGSILLQAILGGVATSFALGAAYWRKLRGFFSNNRESDVRDD
jgi:hypothetical protein